MQEKILLKMDNPPQLEKLYRDNKPAFKTAFNKLYPELKDNPSARVWYERLNYARQDTFWGTSSERTFVVAIGLLAVLFAQLPKIFSLDKDFFYTRNAGFIALPLLMAYFGWKNKVSAKTLTLLSGVVVISIFFINYLPKSSTSDTLVLSTIHLPLLLWSLLGFVFGGGRFKKGLDWLGFLRYNGELLVMTALLLISCGLVSAMTINLFGMIGLQIERHYFEYVVISGLAALPIVSTFLTQVQPAIVNKVSPVIANLFSPVAFVMLVAYLAAIVFSGKDPYHDREFLLLFNGLLIGVMALIFFSVADSPSGEKKLFQKILLFLLSAVTLLVNGIALSAVLFRIAEWGITPNRAAVLGANILMFIHLLFVSARLWNALTKKNDLSQVGHSMVLFLPVYGVWSAVVTFLFPLIFGFK